MNEQFSDLVLGVSVVLIVAIISISVLLGIKSNNELETMYIEKRYCKTYNIQSNKLEWLPCAQIKRK